MSRWRHNNQCWPPQAGGVSNSSSLISESPKCGARVVEHYRACRAYVNNKQEVYIAIENIAYMYNPRWQRQPVVLRSVCVHCLYSRFEADCAHNITDNKSVRIPRVPKMQELCKTCPKVCNSVVSWVINIRNSISVTDRNHRLDIKSFNWATFVQCWSEFITLD